MNWLSSLLFESGSFSHGILAFSIAISLGLYLGKLKFFGLSFGATCVLFVGLIMSWLGIEVDASMLGFFRNFGLILFVFFIGLQVGPSFFATFKSSGAGLVGLMVLAVGLSLAVTVILYFLCAPAVSLPEMLGIMFGAVTSTPVSVRRRKHCSLWVRRSISRSDTPALIRLRSFRPWRSSWVLNDSSMLILQKKTRNGI